MFDRRWGPYGIEMFDANDQFELLTKPSFRDDAKSHGAYHVNRTVCGGAARAEMGEWSTLDDTWTFFVEVLDLERNFASQRKSGNF